MRWVWRIICQLTGIWAEWSIVIKVDSAVKKLIIVVSSNVLNKYLHQLHNFCLLFGVHRKNKKPEIKNIDQIIIGLQEVCVNNMEMYYGLNDEASTQKTAWNSLDCCCQRREESLLWTQESEESFWRFMSRTFRHYVNFIFLYWECFLRNEFWCNRYVPSAWV